MVAVATASPRDTKANRIWKIVSREHANAGQKLICPALRAFDIREKIYKKDKGFDETDIDLLSQRRIGRQYHRPLRA